MENENAIDDATAYGFALANGVGMPLRQADFENMPRAAFKAAAQADTFATPSSITEELRDFAEGISPEFEPQFIELRVDLFEDARRCMCQDNARRCAEIHGGTFQDGWALFVHAGIFMQAVHHCVYWNDGTCIDVTPNPFDKCTLFLAACPPGVRHEVQCNQWGYVPRIYEPLSSDPLVLEIVRLRRLTNTLHGMSQQWADLMCQVYDLTARYREKQRKQRETEKLKAEKVRKRRIRKEKKRQARRRRK